MRFFCDPVPDEGERAVLPEDIFRHAKVLRIEPGDVVELFAEGIACRARVLRIDTALEVQILSRSHATEAEAAPITLVQALPKGKKLDAIVRMAVEIGVDTIQLVTSERTVPHWDKHRINDKLERLQKVAQQAARQSNQARIATVLAPVALAEAAQRAPSNATRLLFWEASSSPLPSRLPHAPTWFAIGPEGGWSQTEAHTLRACGWMEASLPTGILRVETAAPVALALLRDRLTRDSRD